MFIALLIAISLAKDLTIFPQANELWINDLKDLFGSIENPSYELSPINSPFIIQESINLVGSTSHSMEQQPKSLVSNSKFTQFAVLDNTNCVYWTKQTLPVYTPQLLGKQQLQENCYNLDFIDDSTLVIDCLDSKQYNLFVFLQQGSGTKQSKILDKNILSQSSITFRKVNVLDDDCVLLGQSSLDLSIIDVYDLNSMKNTGQTLNTAIITKLAQIKDKLYQFRLVDFISKFGLVYVLDETRLMIFQFKEQWKLNLQIPLESKGVAFDVKLVTDLNGKEKFQLVILTQNGKLYCYNDFVNSPIEMDVIGQSVQISNQYVLVQQNNNLLQINLDDKIIVKKMIWSENKFIVSGLYSSLIEVEATFTKRYILSNGYIQGISKVTTNNQSLLSLKATYKDKQQLVQVEVSKIIYQFLDNSDQNLYQVNSPILFQNAIQGNLYTEYLDPFLSGPNQIYQQELSEQSDITLKFYKQFEQQHIDFPLDIVFQEVIAVDQQQSIMLFQLKNLTVQLWGCNNLVPKSDCLPLIEWIDNDVVLTRNTFASWTYNYDLYFAFTKQSNDVEIWEIQLEKIQRVQKIKNKNQIVQQILGSHKNLFILLQNGDIDIYELGQLVETINPPEPCLQMFNNPYYSSQILIVKTKTTIIVYRFNFIVQEIEYFLNYDTEVFISIYEQSFIVVNSQKITEYLMTPQQIKLTKELPLYNNKIINPIYALKSQHNGLIYIPCDIDGHVSFLVYQPEILAHDSLLQILNTQIISTDLKNVIISVDGFQASLLFFQYRKQNHLYSILKNTQAISTLKSTDKFNDYCQNVDESFSVSNSINQLNFKTKLTVLNRMEKISIVDSNLKEVLLKEQNAMNYLIMEGNWYKGQAVEIKALCKQCSKEVVLNEPVFPLQNYFLDNARIITKFDLLNQIVVNKNTFMIIGENLKSNLNLQLSQEYYSIAVHPTQKYVILAAKNDKNTNLLMISCRNAFSCSQLSLKTVSLSSISQMYLIQEDFLIVSTKSQLIIYHITYTQNSWTLEQKSSTNIDQYSPLQGINYFIVSQIQSDNRHEYAITLLDSTNQILFLFYKIKNGSLDIIKFETRNIYDEIINKAQYSQLDTKYIQLLPCPESEKTFTQLISFKMILITNNVASYGIQFQFDLNYQYHGFQILFIINQYADWITLPQGSIQQNKLCIPYSNGVNNVLLQYSIPNLQQQISKPPTITSISGIRNNVLPLDIPLVVYVFQAKNNMNYLMTNLQRYDSKICVNLYVLNEYPILAVSNSVELDLQQQISVTVGNDFSNAYQQVTLKQLYEPIKSPANIGWIIAIIVIASLIAVVMLFYVMRRRSIRLSYQNYYPLQDQQLRNV